MISFLTPLFLAGLAALAIPVLLHLRRQRLERQTPFGAMLFLEESPPPPKRRRRIEHWLLLLLRLLALALICLAFAWPVWRDVTQEASTKADRQIILLDRSGSMGGAVWEKARSQALELMENLPAESQLWLGTFDEQVEWLWRPGDGDGSGNAGLSMAGDFLKGMAAPANGVAGEPAEAIETALAQAMDESDKRPPRTTLHLISDFQLTNRPDLLAATRLPDFIRVELHGQKDESAARPYLQAIGEVRDLGETLEYAWLVVNPGSSETAATLQLSNGGEEVLTLPADGQEVVTVETDPAVRILKANLAEEPETLGRVAWAAVPPVPELNVAWVSDDRAEDVESMGFYLERALQAGEPFRTVMVEDLAEADLVFLNRPVSEEEAGQLTAFADSGGTVVIVPPDLETLHQLESLLGPGAAAAEEAQLPEDGWRMTGIDYQADEFEPFSEAVYGDFSKIPFWRARLLDESYWEHARILATFSEGTPAIIEIPQGAGRWLLWASSWAPQESQLARSSKFVPLLFALIESSVEFPTGTGWVEAGTPAQAVLREGVALTGPDGNVIDAGARLTAPGIYRDAEGAPVVVVRPAVAELNPATLAASEIEELQTALVVPPQSSVSEEMQVAGGLEQRDWWRVGLIAVILLLFVETLLSGWKQRAQPRAAS